MSEIKECYLETLKLISREETSVDRLPYLERELQNLREMLENDTLKEEPKNILQQISEICEATPEYSPEDFLSVDFIHKLNDALNDIADLSRLFRKKS